MDPRASRGFFNNNPGNMDRSADVWQGEIRDPADTRLSDFQRNELVKGRFCVFSSPQLGIRANAKNLFAYYDKLNLRSVNALIYKWAPPIENDSAAYAAAVAKKLGVSGDATVNVRDWKTLYALIDAIIRVECGGMPYSGNEIEDGLMLAGVVKPVGLTTSKTATGLSIASGGTIAGGAVATVQEAIKQPPQIPAPPVPALPPAPDFSSPVASVQETIRQTAESLAPFAGTSQTLDHILFGLKIALGVIALIGIGLAIRERILRSRRDEQLALAAQENGK